MGYIYIIYDNYFMIFMNVFIWLCIENFEENILFMVFKWEEWLK